MARADYWDSCVNRSGVYTHEHFREAASTLLFNQSITAQDRNQRTLYDVVHQNRSYFETLVEATGSRLEHDLETRLYVIVPTYVRVSMGKAPCLLALVLRHIYHTRALDGYLEDNSEILCELDDLQMIYAQKVGSPLTTAKGEMDKLLGELKLAKLIRVVERLPNSDGAALSLDQPYVIYIRPAIRILLREDQLEKIITWNQNEAENVVNGISEYPEESVHSDRVDDSSIEEILDNDEME